MGFREFCGNQSFWVPRPLPDPSPASPPGNLHHPHPLPPQLLFIHSSMELYVAQDQDLLLNNSWPQFTECFQQTALVWVPCGFLWVSSLLYIPYLCHLKPKMPGKVTWLNSAKILIPLCLAVLVIISLVKTVSLPDQSEVATSLYVEDGVKIGTFLLSGVLVDLERRRGLLASGVQFIFWLFILLSNVIPFYTLIIQQVYNDDLLNFSLFYLQYACMIVMFILQFFTDARSRNYYLAIGEDISPESVASFPSKLTFWWSQRMISTGFRKALESSDLFTMEPCNQSRYIVPPFRKAWKNEEERVAKINSRAQKKKDSQATGIDNGGWTKDDEKLPLLSPHRSLVQTRTTKNGESPSIPDDPAVTQITSLSDITNKSLNGELSHAILSSPEGGASSTQGQGQKSGQGRNYGSAAKGGSGGGDGGGKVQVGKFGARMPIKEDGLVHVSLFRVLAATYWVTFTIGHLLMLIYTLLQFVNPMVLNALLSYVSDRSSLPTWQGYVLACSFFVASFASTFIYHQTMFNMMPLGMRVKSAIITAVYNKALTMSHESKRQSTVGEIVNLMSIDCQRLQDISPMLYLTWSMPLTIAIALYQVWGILGAACLAGLGVMVLVIPINYVVISRQRSLQISTMRIKDQRLKLMAEILNGIKVLKLYGWEPAFKEKVLYHRNKELANLRKIAFLNSASTFVWTLVPYLVTLASFAAYVLTSESGYLDPTKAFVSLSLFNIMRGPINMIPGLITMITQAAVSLGRVNNFLNWGDLDPSNVTKDPAAESIVSIEKGTFTWDTTMPRPVLQNINLQIPKGKLVAVVGPVGCGKSSLLSAMLGEMEKLKGTVTTKDSIAYVPQEAWIQNATLRDNILFGKPLSKRRYNQVVQACALEPDFATMVGGDMTEIGEKGINMSGGQKQRISVARAVYSAADTYLLDDPLSAVDSHVGKHIFQHVIGRQGLLAKKTRILVTHGIHWLPMVDQIIVLSDGTISEVGSYEELLSRDGAFANFLRTYLTVDAESDEEGEGKDGKEDSEIRRIKEGIFQRLESITSDPATSGDELTRSKDSIVRRRKSFSRSNSRVDTDKSPVSVKETMSKLIEEEQSLKGSVKMSVYAAYVRAIGTMSWTFIMILYVLFMSSSLVGNIWLTEWTDDSTLANTSLANTSTYQNINAMYLGVYGALGVLQAVFILGYSILYNTRMVTATGNMHAKMLHTVLRSPMSFFDTTPVGRIINRFSRDVDVMDTNLPMTVRTTIQGAGNLLSTVILISYGSPIFLSIVLPLGILYKLVQTYYISSSRQLKRLESTTRSPVYTHFTETIQGAASIRAYGVSKRFIKESQRRVDANLVCYYAYIVAQRWLGVRLEFLGTLITLGAALFAIINTSLSSGMVGLSVTYAMNVTANLNFLVRNSSELESNIVSTERIKEYSEYPTEAEWTNPDSTLKDSWPEEGTVQFNDFKLRYRPGLDLVLKGITCQVKGGEKIGIVGRTGAGKSSLTVALFRLVEAAGGSIVIDGQLLANMGLHDLRTRLTILPQDPVIFSGTLRMNLDPTGIHVDDDIWKALDLANLHTFVSGLPEQLDYECGEGGQNLSVGQRQLMCLARSVLRKSKILVLDEATAAVDMETDEVIQQTIRSEFKDSTVLTIAHRLNTIMDYDRILVMEQGYIKEFDTPKRLLADPGSTFYSMAKAAGLV